MKHRGYLINVLSVHEPWNDRSDLWCVFVRWRTKVQQANWIGFVDRAQSGNHSSRRCRTRNASK